MFLEAGAPMCILGARALTDSIEQEEASRVRKVLTTRSRTCADASATYWTDRERLRQARGGRDRAWSWYGGERQVGLVSV